MCERAAYHPFAFEDENVDTLAVNYGEREERLERFEFKSPVKHIKINTS